MGRITLLLSILCSLPIYLLTNTMIPATCLRRLERRFRDFLWSPASGRQGTHLLSWDVICLPIAEGGLGLHSLLTRREALFARHASRFVLEPHSFWSSVMRSRYGAWCPTVVPLAPRGSSFQWRSICQYSSLILAATRWMLGDGRSVDIWQDAWLADIPLARWPTFVSMDIEPSSPICTLLCSDRLAWHAPSISRFFGEELALRVLATPLAASGAADVRLWRRSCLPRAPTAHLVDLLRPRLVGLSEIS